MNSSTISIRPAKLSDLKELQGLFVDSISTICKDDYSPEEIRVWTSSIENTPRWTHKLTSQYFLVAELAHQIVGFASLDTNDCLDLLYVHKDYQRQGIAERLFANLEQEAIKQKATTLHADVSKTAKPVFEKMGFSILETQINTIEGIDIVNYKMSKQLGIQPLPSPTNFEKAQ